jgi:peptide/nickel transport system substrate-binding protein
MDDAEQRRRRTYLVSRRLTRRRLLAAGMGGAAALAAACGNKGAAPAARSPAPQASGSAGAPQSGGTLTTSNRDNSPNLDVDRTTSGYTKAPVGAIQSRLLRYQTGPDFHVTEDRKVEGDLATNWESPDAVTWTVKLRPQATFHNVPPVNGHAVEAEDIKATVLRAQDPRNAARSGLDPIDPNQVQTPDSQTVVFKLKYPYADFTATMASPNYFYIFPREALAGSYDPSKQVIGSGPFLFGSYTPDVGWVLKKNSSWFVQSQPYVDQINWNVLPDAARMRAEFTSGQLDLMGVSDGLPIELNDLPTLQHDNPKAQLIKGDPRAGSILFVQLGDPNSPFQDIRLRRAVSMGIDRDTLAKVIYNGNAQPQFYAYLSLGDKALHMSDLPADTAQYYKLNPSQTKQLLQASGFADHEFKLVYFSGFLGPQYEQTGQTLANMLASSGLKVTALELDYQRDYIGGGKGVRYGNYSSDWLIYTGLSGYDTVDEFMFNYFASSATSSLARLHDPEFDAMLAKDRAVLDESARTKAYLDLQRYVADKMYAIGGLPQPPVYTMVQPRVQNFQLSVTYGLGTESFAKLWMKA